MVDEKRMKGTSLRLNGLRKVGLHQAPAMASDFSVTSTILRKWRRIAVFSGDADVEEKERARRAVPLLL